jgi:hypothetical protein
MFKFSHLPQSFCTSAAIHSLPFRGIRLSNGLGFHSGESSWHDWINGSALFRKKAEARNENKYEISMPICKAVPSHTMEEQGERKCISYSFLTSALDGGEWSASRPGRALLPGKDHGTYCTEGWVGPRAGLDTEERGKIHCPCQGSNLDRPVVQSVARHYIDWATLAPYA